MKTLAGALSALALLSAASAARADVVTPVSVVASSTQNNYSADSLIDGSGLSADGLHDGNWASMWMTQQGQGASQGWLVFDLGDVYDLTGADVWQYNFLSPPFIPGVINTIYRGTKELRILTSLDGVDYEEVYVGTLDLGTGEPIAATGMAFSATAQFVRFDILDNLVPEGYLEDTYPTYGVGLSEVRFNSLAAVPEPASWAMMIGGFALAGFAMRRRAALAFA